MIAATQLRRNSHFTVRWEKGIYVSSELKNAESITGLLRAADLQSNLQQTCTFKLLLGFGCTSANIISPFGNRWSFTDKHLQNP